MTGFLDYSPLVKGAFLGVGKCLIWAHLGGVWDTEVACYENDVLKHLEVSTSRTPLQGTFVMSSGDSIGWVVGVDGSYQLGLVPTVGTSSVKTGIF